MPNTDYKEFFILFLVVPSNLKLVIHDDELLTIFFLLSYSKMFVATTTCCSESGYVSYLRTNEHCRKIVYSCHTH